MTDKYDALIEDAFGYPCVGGPFDGKQKVPAADARAQRFYVVHRAEEDPLTAPHVECWRTPRPEVMARMRCVGAYELVRDIVGVRWKWLALGGWPAFRQA